MVRITWGQVPQSLDMSVALHPSLLSWIDKLCGRRSGAVAVPDSLLLIPAFTVSFHGSVLAVGVCGLQSSWVPGWGPGDREFPSQEPSVLVAAPSPSWVPAPCLCTVEAIAYSCHWSAFCDGWPCLAGLTLLPMLPTHALQTSLINPDEGLRIHLNTALQAIAVDDVHLGRGCWGKRAASESATCATQSL